MRPANLSVLLLAALAVCGCGRTEPPTPATTRTGGEDPSLLQAIFKTQDAGTSKTNTKPEALCRENYLRLDQGPAEAELRETFGPPQEVWQEGKDSRKYTWKSGQTKLEVTVKGGKVVASLYPGEHEERGKRLAAHLAARALVAPLRAHVLKNKNRFPERLEDLDLGPQPPDWVTALKRGDVVVPWGKSANRLVWAYWKDTPQFGGPYVRFDGKDFPMVSPQEFARLNAVVLTADTIPADVAAEGKPGPGDPKTFSAMEKKDCGFQGFFTAGVLARFLASKPGSLDELPTHLARNYWDVGVLRQLEKGEIIVRWGRDPSKCVYAYPRGFPQAGDPNGWAIYKGQWAPFARIEEAQKAFAE